MKRVAPLKIAQMRLHWRMLMLVGLTVCLIALLLHSTATDHAPIAALFFLPISLFSLVLVPCSLWPPSPLDEQFTAPILSRTNLFQRPPPYSKN